MSEKIRIVIVDDHSLVIDGLKARLERIGFLEVVGEANDGQVGIEVVKRLQPDIVLMDINMPKMSGIVVAEILAEKTCHIKLLIHDDESTDCQVR